MSKRAEATLTGRITSLTVPGAGPDPSFRVGLDIDGQPLVANFVGFREIAGFSVGQLVTVTGRLTRDGTSAVMYNPTYTFEPETR